MTKLVCTNSCHAAILAAAKETRDTSRDYLLFSDDKTTVALENAVLSEQQSGVAFHVTVTSFSRFLSRSGKAPRALSKEGSSMAIRRIMEGGDFSVLPKAGGKKNLAASLYEMIAQLKSACVLPEELAGAKDRVQAGLLQRKLTDLSALYEAYENFLKEEKTTDQGGFLSALPDYLKTGVLKGKPVFLVGYSAFTTQMERIVTALVSSGAEVTAFLSDEEAKQAFLRAVSLAGESAEMEEFNEKEGDVPAFLRKNLYGRASYDGSVKTEADCVGIYAARTVEEEIDFVARALRARVRKGARYRDFAVIVPDEKAYRESVRAAFSLYGIPYFLDRKRTLCEHPLFRFLTGFLSLSLFGLTENTVIPFVQNPYFGEEKTDAFVRYVRRYGVIGTRFSEPFTLDVPEKEEAERVRKKFAAFYKKLKNEGTGAEFLSETAEFLNRTAGANENWKDLFAAQPDLADFTRQAEEKLTALVEEIGGILGDAPLSLQEFCDVLSAGAEAAEMSGIPTKVDCVTVAEPEKTLSEIRPYLFAVGMTHGVPTVSSDTAFLSDRDLLALENVDVTVNPRIGEVNDRKRRAYVAALSAFSEGLILTYPALSETGEEQLPSEIVTFLCRMLKKKGEPLSVQSVEVTEKSLWAERYATDAAAKETFYAGASDYVDGLQKDLDRESGYYTYIKNKDAREAEMLGAVKETDGLRGRDFSGDATGFSVSPTGLEGYFKCPYRYFLEKVLYLAEPKKAEVEATDSGTLIHAVLEDFGKEMQKGTVNGGNVSQTAERIFEEREKDVQFALKKTSKRNDATFTRLKKEAVRACVETFAHFAHSDFCVAATEQEFCNDKNDKNLSLDFSVGSKKISLKGKIDRVDESEDFIRVVDYKTGKIDDGYGEIYMGEKLQLPLYLAVAKENYKKPIAGVYYFPVRDKFEEEPSPALLRGKTLESYDAVTQQDHTLKGITENKDSSVLYLKLKPAKEGEIKADKKGANDLLDEGTFQAFGAYAKAVSEKGLKELSEGFILPTPKDGACEYCPYGGVCGREPMIFPDSGRTAKDGNAKFSAQTLVKALGLEEAKKGGKTI